LQLSLMPPPPLQQEARCSCCPGFPLPDLPLPPSSKPQQLHHARRDSQPPPSLLPLLLPLLHPHPYHQPLPSPLLSPPAQIV